MSANTENIIQLDFSEEMKTSYRDYAMSVIIARAVPDVREAGSEKDPVCHEGTGAVPRQAPQKKRPYRR